MITWKATMPKIGLLIGLLLTACSPKTPSFSILPSQEQFSQNGDEVNSALDILWVVDNSGSMDSSQKNLANNLSVFINKFVEKKFNFQMAVTTTEAYRDLYGGPADIAKFKDGTDYTSHTGKFIVNQDTFNLIDTFLVNVVQLIYGSGDERAFQSIERTLAYSGNSDFVRKNAFLAIILLSDEDDFSHNGSESRGGQYTFPGLHTTDYYVDYLDQLKGATSTDRQYKYNFSTISILDETCLATLNAESPGRKIGVRYQDLANKTSGIIGSLCGNFGETLASISNRILELSTRFKLSRDPNPDTIEVWINGLTVPRDPYNGFSYDKESNSIIFHGSFVPPAGAKIGVKFDPSNLI